ncbi:MAG: hypothetical protein AAB444_02310 [Patescibacteria group bacterium]
MMKRMLPILLSALFLILLFFLSFSSAGKFNTPDESAHFYFARLFVETGSLKSAESQNMLVENVLHPRAVNVVRGFLVPEGFWGLPLIYGALAKLFGTAALPFFTGAIALASLPAAYVLFRSVFGLRVAKLAILLLALNPVFWYNASRGFYHNSLFACLLVVSLSMLALAWRGYRARAPLWFVLSGLAAGSALVVRPAEVVWVAGLFFVLGVAQLLRRNFSVFWFAAVFFPLMAIPLVNHDLYGGVFRFGYAVSENPVSPSTVEASEAVPPKFSAMGLVGQLFLPFGYHPGEAFHRVARYGILPIWWCVLPVAFGFLALFRPGMFMGSAERRYALLWAIFSLYLTLAYGSFNAEFFTDPGQIPSAGIGSAYLRYWLPVYIFASPFAAVGWLFLWDKFRGVPFGRKACVPVVILTVFFSARAVFWNGAESLASIAKDVSLFREQADRAQSATLPESVFFIPKWADRVYFPEQRVAVDLEGKNVVKIVVSLLKSGIPVFQLRGRGEVTLVAEEMAEESLRFVRRFDLDPKGKVYEIERAGVR